MMQAQEIQPLPANAQAAVEMMQPRTTVGRFSLVNASFEDMQRVGSALVKCGYYKDIRDVAQCCAKLLAGQELGLTLMEALTGLRFIEGKIEMAPTLMAARVNRLADKGYSYRVEWIAADEKDANGDPVVIGCRIRFKRDGDELGVSTFTFNDAKTAGLVRDGGNYKKYPRNMYYARAMSNGIKWYMPEVLGGGQVYVADEIAGTDFEAQPERALAPVSEALPSLPPDLVHAGAALGILPLGIHADLKKNGGDVTGLLAQYNERFENKHQRGATIVKYTQEPVLEAKVEAPAERVLPPSEQALLNDINAFAPKSEGPIPANNDKLKKAQQHARMNFDKEAAQALYKTREDRLKFASWAIGRSATPITSFTELSSVAECELVVRALNKEMDKAPSATASMNDQGVDCPCCGAGQTEMHFAGCELAA